MPNDPQFDPLRTVERVEAADASTIGRPGDGTDATTDSADAAAVPHRSKWPSIPGYEVTQELGRGGMGVVYLARQAGLKRLVALKMIRGGGDATPEQLERFRAEAEAVARLQHPNIVQIFEVGEHCGDPFIALEYVAGGSMAEALARGAWAYPRAAETVETLARALHHSHQKNVIHRDLKPANVLLTDDLVPKVTDFGLAKRLEEGGSGRTRTGAVMGTPSYMAPEQASGRIDRIGPATDVYALGAILYEALAGRTAFAGESVLDTLEMVRSAEPEAPSKIRPGVPADLETICLKAMSKDPEARYSSALALAQDLERYRGGEPILGKRMGRVRKAIRKIRRYKAALAVALALLAVAGTLAFAAWNRSSSRELRSAEEAVAKGLDRTPLDTEAADAAERDIARLTDLDADRGRDSQRKLLERFAASLRSELSKPRISEAEAPGLETRLAWLALRDPQLARGLDGDLRARLRSWQPLAEVAAPFANARDVFPPGAVRLDAERFYSVGPVLPTLIPSQGTIKLEVDFEGEWFQSGGLGLLIGSQVDRSGNRAGGYMFVLRPAWNRGDPDSAPRPGTPPSFEAAGGIASLEILRDGARLGVADVAVRPGSLRIAAERDGDRLAIRLNGADSIAFEDPVPLPIAAGSNLAVLVPPGVAVRRLRAEERALPAAASRLERADDFYSRGRYADALSQYQAFARETADADSKSEARCKAGLCLVGLERGGEAAEQFEEVATGGNPRWGVISAFQLWLIRLKAKQFEEADAMLAVIKLRFPKEAILRYVPIAVRTEIDFQSVMPPINWLIFDPKLIPKLESAIRVAEVLQLKSGGAEAQAITLVRAHCLAGDYRRARTVASEYCDAVLNQGHIAGGTESPSWMIRWQAWAGRLDGRPEDFSALRVKHLDGPLREGEDADERRRAFVPLRLESARNHAAAGKWDSAEGEIDAYLAEYPSPIRNYVFHSQAYFMKGFARLKAGDRAGAESAWKVGTYARFKEGLPVAARTPGGIPASRIALAENWAMESLTGSLADEDAALMVKALTSSFGSEEIVGQIASALNFSPAIIRGVWISPRGKEWARRMAYLDLTPNEYFWTAPRLIVYEKFRQDLLDGAPTEEEDEALWQTIVRLSEAFRTGALSKGQVFQLALAWKGTTNLLGWGGVAPKLDPALRGPVAYALGLRYRKLNKAADAADLFKMAASDAPAGSALKKLAEAALVPKK